MWSYINAKNSNKDYVRYLLGDTDEHEQILQDEEIEVELEEIGLIEPTPVVSSRCKKVAITCCNRIVAKYSKEVNYTIGPESVRAGDRLGRYKALRKSLIDEITSQCGGPVVVGYQSPPTFQKGMMDYRG